MSNCEALEKDLDDFKDQTQTFIIEAGLHLEHMAKVQRGHQETLFGKVPPDDLQPGLVIEGRENTALRKNIKKFSWLVIGGFAAGLGTSIWLAIKVMG